LKTSLIIFRRNIFNVLAHLKLFFIKFFWKCKLSLKDFFFWRCSYSFVLFFNDDSSWLSTWSDWEKPGDWVRL
jgi:hypothetical protein